MRTVEAVREIVDPVTEEGTGERRAED
jgi:hypothetical protein